MEGAVGEAGALNQGGELDGHGDFAGFGEFFEDPQDAVAHEDVAEGGAEDALEVALGGGEDGVGWVEEAGDFADGAGFQVEG